MGLRKSARDLTLEIGRFVDEYQGFAWIGLLVGVVGLFVSPSNQLAFFRGLSIAVIFLALGALLTAWIVRLRTDFKLRRCDKRYFFEGPRGAETRTVEHSCWTSLTNARYLRFSVISSEGSHDEGTIRYRYCGRKGQDQQEWTTLREDDIIRTRTSHGEVEVTLRLPAPVEKKDWFEIEWNQEITDAFPKDTEAVGKHVLYPIRELFFELHFAPGTVTDVAGIEEGARARQDHTTLTPVDEPSADEVYRYQVEKVKPGHDHAVSWTWA